MLSQIMLGHKSEIFCGWLDYEVPVLEGEGVYPGGQVLPVGLRAREDSQYC